MDGYRFDWHGLRLEARASGALWWPEARWLLVADLHLGKSERMARRGGALLPPYEGLATLERLGAEITALDPAVVVSLGDGFDDDAASGGLDATVRAMLEDLARGRDWLWLAGNHDPLRAAASLPGRIAAEAAMGGVTARHEAGAGPDISGHFHPVVRLGGGRRRAFLIGAQHLILPAFGAYTGGLDANAPALARLAGGGLAVACLHRAVPVPLARMAG
ncbi:ligase-associated DNA damage response endonuclease PdeM [Paracoccus sp. S-4012]|uniref:ligase-associated DNA damage response endonuclease PdeM n=1 Tax=Paracoccus sp. S-4012 TaxID=2665648 RepID=UPI0012B04E20|nr:ligase-associated DNA damage response endonuclease PdeM [Paracoccus sp. S-4012]MRX49036.1 ligase-associated DNA damage response endonuclease PdeM [Paracoccus sp. S-4012]